MRNLDEADRAIAAIITDIRFGGEDLTGWDIACRAREVLPTIGVVYECRQRRGLALEGGARQYLSAEAIRLGSSGDGNLHRTKLRWQFRRSLTMSF